eukprot:CAMPEP_0174373428 /NCGR_PEP_ID=MMETSP0811_2-20130205/107028_1 /TAXON_ID=73025 ORGANISM="Eutreptiella gymnastica-like, Strain CCMP1594" /NCGR_SAMPLE_ID=MMETSP0811_2 /ASSEMBLY_ACC=CAM_ASM_000667 /LENGTH=76 /DNA_ID=CAMNT_0015521719 /DNA_START=344 /DNA_END=570 /DNA_ORIENTATION=-
MATSTRYQRPERTFHSIIAPPVLLVFTASGDPSPSTGYHDGSPGMFFQSAFYLLFVHRGQPEASGSRMAMDRPVMR